VDFVQNIVRIGIMGIRNKLLNLLVGAYESGAHSMAGVYSKEKEEILKREFEIELDKLGIEKEEQFVWKKARKKPIVIEFREVKRKEIINTREGQQTAFPEQDFIIKGVEGEEYPIKKDIFEKTYEVIENGKK
jgi:hypothetical protein